MSESIEKDAKTSARVLPFGTVGPLEVTTPLGLGEGAAAAAGAPLARRSSAHDLGGAGFGGEATLAVSAAAVTSVATSDELSAVTGSGWAAVGDLADFCVVDVALGFFADLIGIRGTAGLVVLRECLVAGTAG